MEGWAGGSRAGSVQAVSRASIPQLVDQRAVLLSAPASSARRGAGGRAPLAGPCGLPPLILTPSSLGASAKSQSPRSGVGRHISGGCTSRPKYGGRAIQHALHKCGPGCHCNDMHPSARPHCSHRRPHSSCPRPSRYRSISPGPCSPQSRQSCGPWWRSSNIHGAKHSGHRSGHNVLFTHRQAISPDAGWTRHGVRFGTG